MLNQVKSSGDQTPIPGSARASTPLSRSLAVPSSSTNATPIKKGTSSTLPPRSSGGTTPPAALLLGGTSNAANDPPVISTAGKLKAPPPAAKVVKNFMNPHAERDAQLERDACIQHHQRDRVIRPPVAESLDDKELHELDAMAAALRGVQWQEKLPSVREFLASSSQPRQLQQLASSSLFQAVPKGASSSMRLAASFHVLDEVDLHWVPYAGLVEPLLLAEGQPLSAAAGTKASSSSHHLRPSPLPLVVQRRISLSNRNAKVLYQSGAVRRGAVGPFRWHYVDETSEGVLPPAQPVEDESTLDLILDFILVNDDTAEEDAESMVPLALQHLVEPDDPQTIPSQFDAEDRDLHTKYGKRNLLSFSLLRLSLCHEEELQLVANQQHKTSVASLSSAAAVPRKRDSSALIDSPRSAYILLKNGQQLSELKKEPRNFQSRSVQHHLLRKQTAKERREIAELEVEEEQDEADRNNNNSPTKNRSLSHKRSDEDPSEARKLRVLDELQKQYKDLCKRCSQKDMVLCLLGIPRRGLSSGGSERVKGGGGTTLLFPLPSSRGEGGGGGTPHRLAPLNHNSTITSPERPVSSSCVSTALASTYPSGPSPLSKHSPQHNFAGTAAFASPTQNAVLSSLQKDRSRQARMERKKREDLAVMWGQMHASTLERAMREERAAAQVAEALEDKRRKARRDTPGGGGGLSHSTMSRNSPHPQRDGATVRSCDSNGGTPARQHPNHRNHNTSDNEGGEDGNLSLSRPSRTSQQTNTNNLAQAAPSSPSSSPTVSASSPPRVGHNDHHRNNDSSMAMLSPVERVRRMYAEKEAARIQELEEGLRRKSEAVARAQLANEQRQRERREECARRAADVREKCEKVKRVADFNTYLLLCQLEQSTGAVETQQRRREELNQSIQAVLHDDHRHSVQAREAFETATVLLQKTMHEEECRTATMMEQYKQQHHSASQSSLNHSSSKLLEDGNRTRSGGGRRPSDGGASGALPSNKTPLSRGLLPTSPAHSERLLPLLHDELDELNEEDEEALEEAAKERQRLADEVEKRAKLLNCRRKKKRRVPTGVDDQQLMDDTRHSLVRLLASTTK